MAQFPKSYGRRRMEELTAKRALGSIDLPSKLFGFYVILAVAADDEVTYFNRFVVFRQEPPRKTSTRGGEACQRLLRPGSRVRRPTSTNS